jgi:DNA repair protein RecN (Recombination protein N)
VLIELRVENLLLIERAALALAPGLNVITGETGAGKTVLAHSLDLLLGGRARGGIVRPGASEVYVEGLFTLPPELEGERGELLPADAEEVLLARRVGLDGRTRAYVNGRSAAVGDLRALGERLISFYGQHEHRRLTLSAAQLELLDEYCGPAHAERLRACAVAHGEVRGLRAELERLGGLIGERERELGLLEHELGEIEAAAPEEGEHERLRADRERLRRREELRAATAQASEALAPDSPESPGASGLLSVAAAMLDSLAGLSPELDSLAARSRSLAIEAADLAAEVRGCGERLEGEEGTLQAVEERLEVLERLERKYGGTPAAVLAYAEGARARRAELLEAEIAVDELSGRLRTAEAGLAEHVAALRETRREAGARLAEAVREQLAALAMPEASFTVELSEREVGPGGADAVELMIAPNPGVRPGPVREIASGGELSRVMLALSAVALGAGVRGDPDTGGELGAGTAGEGTSGGAGGRATVVFDEVDAGIGGHTARAVGERLRDLAGGRQVLCITHLPQIASLGERHFSIAKDTTVEPARTTVRTLAEGEVVSELVRMLGASEEDVAARRHARELRRAA